jgi:transcriptional regulator with XRE-family HTH domain
MVGILALQMEKQTTSFGKYLRHCRVASNLSLRQLADKIGVGHVYLGEVERGVRGPLKRDRWTALCNAMSPMSMVELERHAKLSRPIQLNLSSAPPTYQNLALALARRLENRDLSKNQLDLLKRVLDAGGDE